MDFTIRLRAEGTAETRAQAEAVRAVRTELEATIATAKAAGVAPKAVFAAQKAKQKKEDGASKGTEKETANAEKKAVAIEKAQAREDASRKKTADRAIEQKKKALAEQQKIDTALQVLNLITASANIYKSYSTIPFVGIPLAIGVIATMFGAFIAAKTRAAQAAKFKHGGEGRVDGNSIIVGASHDTGGVGIEAEGGEFFGTDGKRFGVVNKKMTAKHFDLIDAINRDDRGKMREALERLTGPTMLRDAVLNAAGASGGMIAVIGGGDKKTHSLLKDIKEKTSKTVTVEGQPVEERDGHHPRRRRTPAPRPRPRRPPPRPGARPRRPGA